MRTFVLPPAVAASLAVACVTAPGVVPSEHPAESRAVSLTAGSKPAAVNDPAVQGYSLSDISVADVLTAVSGNIATVPAAFRPVGATRTWGDVLAALPAGAQPTVSADGGAPAAAARQAIVGEIPVPVLTAITAALDLLALPIQIPFALIAGVNIPPAFPVPAQWVSVYTVINNAIAVLRTPLSLLFTGQWSAIPAQTAVALTTFGLSVTEGLPLSLAAEGEYISQTFAEFAAAVAALFATGGAAAPASAAPTDSTAVETDAVAAVSTPLDVLGLPLQMAVAILAGGTAGVTVPAAALPNYTSVYTVINNAISVLRTPLSLLTTGQWSGIPAQTATAWGTFVTSLTVGLPASVASTFAYAASVLGGMPVSAESESLSANAKATVEALADTDVAKSVEIDDTLEQPAAETADEAPADENYLSRLQAAVSKELARTDAAEPTVPSEETETEESEDEAETEETEPTDETEESKDDTESEEPDDTDETESKDDTDETGPNDKAESNDTAESEDKDKTDKSAA